MYFAILNLFVIHVIITIVPLPHSIRTLLDWRHDLILNAQPIFYTQNIKNDNNYYTVATNFMKLIEIIQSSSRHPKD